MLLDTTLLIDPLDATLLATVPTDTPLIYAAVCSHGSTMVELARAPISPRAKIFFIFLFCFQKEII